MSEKSTIIYNITAVIFQKCNKSLTLDHFDPKMRWTMARSVLGRLTRNNGNNHNAYWDNINYKLNRNNALPVAASICHSWECEACFNVISILNSTLILSEIGDNWKNGCIYFHKLYLRSTQTKSLQSHSSLGTSKQTNQSGKLLLITKHPLNAEPQKSNKCKHTSIKRN